MSASTWIVIVNYRTADPVVDCLRALSTPVDAVIGSGWPGIAT